MPASFRDQLTIVGELRREVSRMEAGEKKSARGPTLSSYESELRLAGLAQRVAQAYTVIEGVLGFVARRIDRSPVTGKDWHKQLIARCARPSERPKRPAVISDALAGELAELCEFRHVVRNIYPTRLDERRVRENLERLIRAARSFDGECKTFAATAAAAPKPRRRSRD